MKILLIVLLIAITVPQVDAKSKCDTLFQDSYFTQIERKDYPECVKRWDVLTRIEIMKYKLNEKKFLNHK